MKLLKKVSSIAINKPNRSGDLMMCKKLIPEDRIAFISLSSESLPNIMREESNIAIGTDRAIIHARFRKRYSKIVIKSSPLPRNRSIALRRKLINKIKVIISNEKMKG
tara:strand:+ start:2248 stop:2571 length:324 start_codon:yes stop_codon:yes gene_type:complete